MKNSDDDTKAVTGLTFRNVIMKNYELYPIK